ncbi:MAG: hypothetical protein Q4A82_02750 [Corynebacterium sp.]|nr:hypothetical protein [Corynebacterium sp.]
MMKAAQKILTLIIICGAIAACGEPGSAKEKPVEQVIPPLGQLPELPQSFFPPPSTEKKEPTPVIPSPLPTPSPVTVTQTVSETPPPPPPPAPAPAPQPAITIPLPRLPRLF